MKVGDLVTCKMDSSGSHQRAGIVVDLVEKKMWNVDVLGKSVNWAVAPLEPHAVLLIGEKYITLPVDQLEVLGD